MSAALSPTPTIYKVPQLSNVQIAAATGVANEIPGRLGPFNFVFPRAVEVIGLLVIPEAGTREALAQLSIGIVDELDEQIVTDYRGFVDDQEQPFFVPCLSLFGKDFRHFKLSRFVRGGERWIWAMRNFSAAAVRVASTSMLVVDAEKRRAP